MFICDREKYSSKVLMEGFKLNFLCDHKTQIADVISEATLVYHIYIYAVCYGSQKI